MMTTEERLSSLERRFNALLNVLGLQPPTHQPVKTSQAESERIAREFEEKITSWDRGEHPWQLAREAHYQQMDEIRQAKEGDHPGQAHDRAALDARLDAIEPMRQQQR